MKLIWIVMNRYKRYKRYIMENVIQTIHNNRFEHQEIFV